MALYQVTVAIWLLFGLFNGAGYMIGTWGVGLCSEPELSHLSCGWATNFVGQGFNQTEIDASGYGIIENFTDPSNTLVSNLTLPQNVTLGNHTGGEGSGNLGLDPIFDAVDASSFTVLQFTQFITGEFTEASEKVCAVCNFITNSANSQGIELPEGTIPLIVLGLGITNALFVVFMLTGKAF